MSQPRSISELFLDDPLGWTDSEFEQQILPYLRAQRERSLLADAKGEKQPQNKKLSPPVKLDLASLGQLKLGK